MSSVFFVFIGPTDVARGASALQNGESENKCDTNERIKQNKKS